MFWGFETVRFMTEYCVTLDTTFDEDDVTDEKCDMENRKDAKFEAILASSSLRIVFVAYISPELSAMVA